MTMLKQTRIEWIDYAKCIAIFFVVLIHTHCDYLLTITLKSFTMPVFFFISGFLFSRKRNRSYRDFVYKRFRQLVVPYLWINVLAYLIWLTVLRHYGNANDAALEWHEPLLAVVLGLPPGLVHDIPLWSLLCFFVVEIAYYPLRGNVIKNDAVIALIFLVLSACVSILSPDEGMILPVSLAPAASAMVFYSLGHLVHKYENRLKNVFQPNILMLLLSVLMITVGVTFNAPVNFFMGHIGHPIFFMVGAAGGIWFIVQVSAYFSRLLGDPSCVRFISRGTLLICGFHLLAFAVIKGVMLFVFGIEPSALTEGVWRGILMALTALILCLPCIWLIERYARFLVSK